MTRRDTFLFTDPARQQAFAIGLAALLGLAAALPVRAATYAVAFDTSAIAGSSGSIDFQWNVGAIDPALRASVYAFSGPSFGGAAVLLPPGDVSGTLAPADGLHFGGTQPFTYLYQPVTFGADIRFMLTLPDSAPMGGSFGSAFVVSLFDLDLSPALPTSSPDLAALVFDLAPGAAPVLTKYSAATVTPVVAAAVPEPATWALSVVGLAAIGCYRRRASGCLR